MSKMTVAEAIYCMQSYLPDDRIEHCVNCPYYNSVKVNDKVYTCRSDEAHRMAIEALKQYIVVSVRLRRGKDGRNVTD